MRLMLDTSVLIAADAPPADAEVAVASVTFAELSYGARAAVDPVQQAIRQARLTRLTRELGPGLPFDDTAAAAPSSPASSGPPDATHAPARWT